MNRDTTIGLLMTTLALLRWDDVKNDLVNKNALPVKQPTSFIEKHKLPTDITLASCETVLAICVFAVGLRKNSVKTDQPTI